jgi:DNA-binding transcriptional LysR family regulator
MAIRINLDLDTLRTLVIAHDRGGLAQAAEHLGRTPSAISLQMKRLKEDLGVPIFRKRGRGLVLTEAGETVLSYARRILILNDELVDTTHRAGLAGHVRIGCPQDFASTVPSVLSQLASLYPRMQIELHVEGNAALLDAIEKACLDLAVIIGHEGHANAQTVGRLNLVWIASSAFSPPRNEPLPLAVLGPQCAFRRRASQELEAASIPCRIAANSPNLNGLWAALLGGLGVTARTALNLPEGLVSGDSLHGLPPLGSMPVTLHRHPGFKGATADRIASLLMKALESVLQPVASTRAAAYFQNDAVIGRGKRERR